MFGPQFDKMLIYFQLILVHLLSFKNITSMLICWSLKRLTWRLRSTLWNMWKPNFTLHKMPMCKNCHCKFVNINAQPWAQCLPCNFFFFYTYPTCHVNIFFTLTITWGKCKNFNYIYMARCKSIYQIPLMTIRVHFLHWLVVSVS
jgi:hypothetical protein